MFGKIWEDKWEYENFTYFVGGPLMPSILMKSVGMPPIVIEIMTECQDWSCSIECFYFWTQLVSLIDSI